MTLLFRISPGSPERALDAGRIPESKKERRDSERLASRMRHRRPQRPPVEFEAKAAVEMEPERLGLAVAHQRTLLGWRECVGEPGK